MNSVKKYNCICFLETQEQFKLLSEYKINNNNIEILIIAVTPEIDYLCNKSDVKYIPLEELFSWKKLNRIGCSNNENIEELCDAFDEIIKSSLPGYPYIDVLSLRANYHSLKIYFDSLIHRLVPIIQAFEKYKPSKIICFKNFEYQLTSTNFMERSNNLLSSLIVPLVLKTYNCDVVWISMQSNCNTAFNDKNLSRTELLIQIHKIRSYIRSIVTKSKLYKNIIRTVFFILQKRIISSYLSHSLNMDLSNKPILISNITHENLADIVYLYWRNEFGCHVFDYSIFDLSYKIYRKFLNFTSKRIALQLWENFENNELLMKHYIINNVNLKQIITKFLRLMTINDIGYMLSRIPAIVQGMELLKNKAAVIMTGGMVFDNYTIARLCTKYHIPIFSVHYGSGSGFAARPTHDRYDLADFDVFVVNGVGSRAAYQYPDKISYWRKDRKRAKPIAVGALWLDDFIEKYRNHNNGKSQVVRHRKRLMYVTQSLNGDLRYLGYVFPPEIWYYKFQIRFFDFISQYKDVELLVKFPPRNRYPQINNPALNWLKENNCKNITIMQDSRFEDVYDIADAYFIDSPGTSLQYMAVTDKPIIVYSDKSIYKFTPSAAKSIGKRGYYTDSEESLFAFFKTFLIKNDWAISQPVNDEFSRKYNTHKNDGKSSERLAHILFNTAIDYRKKRIL